MLAKLTAFHLMWPILSPPLPPKVKDHSPEYKDWNRRHHCLSSNQTLRARSWTVSKAARKREHESRVLKKSELDFASEEDGEGIPGGATACIQALKPLEHDYLMPIYNEYVSKTHFKTQVSINRQMNCHIRKQRSTA